MKNQSNNQRITAAMEELAPIIKEQLAEGKSVRFSPKGISMLPMLRQGVDTVTLSPLPDIIKKYDIPLYQRENGQYVLHRVVKVGETYSMIGDNQFVVENNVKHSQLIAVVTAFTRGERIYSVDNLSYKVYCRFWHYTRALRHLWRRVVGKIKHILHLLHLN